ncbi:hypothetical protein IU436_29325 [Nocardia farcinica]|uniref:hypothetical protein n=1 Tax=Nocardia farcinica TaxID=37329 RepID=UPI001892D746|nr:hypothetical protein [Nocardia farcinica]MBF6422725.1 hypothetical protein [Nocardia farcinica]MBF6434425.1 hypothetical protein [Nocardia farcinica]MBF6505510.1 hypothetical protein [Nocardia farcinica]
MGTSLNDLLADPDGVLARLTARQAGVTVDRTRAPRCGGFGLDLSFAPPPELVAAGYGTERARISITPSAEIMSFPLGPVREWKHRYPFTPEDGGYQQLCLWFPSDPRPLRWVWDDGLDDYVARVHRHLFYEEFWRRTGRWPSEDAPHGPGAPGQMKRDEPIYPVQSPQLRAVVDEYRRSSHRRGAA